METKTVLLVEDNEDNRIVYSTILRHHGFEVLEAVDGDAAVRLTRERQPDAVLMDISIPILDGWKATGILKRDPETAAIPIIALTAHALDVDRERAFAAGCDAYLVKPCEPRRVVAELIRLIGPPPAVAD